MSEIELCETCGTPFEVDDLLMCEATGLNFCDTHRDDHVAGCGLCAYELMDNDIRRPGK
jgi:hypothetical protein